MEIDKDKLYTVPEACSILRISLPTLNRMIQRGDVPVVYVGTGGRSRRFLGSDLLDLIARGRRVTPPKEDQHDGS